ncbi:hypothetical protein [Xylophilus sp. ASV27]|uniref:hypothetical protein n=1 Tax=Xylophilus sp. ASV27 TaxID=2795129 RepID=UPI001E567CF1|nr:hypothetical protein [Xylophilus sp. ASV27]
MAQFRLSIIWYMSPASDSLSPDILQALAASAAGDSATAIELFKRAAQLAPSSAIPHYLLAAEQAHLGLVEQAEHSFANALLLQPDMNMARFQLGLLQYFSDREALALLTWQPLKELEPTDALRHFVTGFDALAHSRYIEARDHITRGLICNKENPALNADMQQVVARIDALQPSAIKPEAHIDSTDQELETSHVLLANYQQPGPAH